MPVKIDNSKILKHEFSNLNQNDNCIKVLVIQQIDSDRLQKPDCTLTLGVRALKKKLFLCASSLINICKITEWPNAKK